MSGMVAMPLELDVFRNELSDKLDPFEMSPNRTFSEDVPTRSPRSPVGPAATISVEMRAELDAEGAELWNQASNRAESIITKWFSDVRGMTDEKKERLRKVPTRHALAFCSSLAPDRTARHAQWGLTYRCPPVLQAADATRKAAMTSAAEHNAFEAEKMAAREVRHRLCHALPLPSRLRHRLLPCASTAFAAKTPPLPCASTAFTAKTPPLPCTSTAFAAKTLPSLAVRPCRPSSSRTPRPRSVPATRVTLARISPPEVAGLCCTVGARFLRAVRAFASWRTSGDGWQRRWCKPDEMRTSPAV